MKMQFKKLSLLVGLLAFVLASPVAHATKMLDKSTFKYDPGTSYEHSALFTRFGSKELITEHEVVVDLGEHHGSWEEIPRDCVIGCDGDGDTHKIPEPGTLVLFFAGMFSLLIARRYKTK